MGYVNGDRYFGWSVKFSLRLSIDDCCAYIRQRHRRYIAWYGVRCDGRGTFVLTMGSTVPVVSKGVTKQPFQSCNIKYPKTRGASAIGDGLLFISSNCGDLKTQIDGVFSSLDSV